MKLLTGIIVLSLIADGALLARYRRYERETERLRAGMTTSQRERADLVIGAEQHRIRVELELVRRQARGDRRLHLAINVDSGRMVLEREGVVLREMAVAVAPQRFRGGDSTVSVSALGQRTVARVYGPKDSWEVPSSVFTDRGLEVPANRTVRNGLGQYAIALNDNTVIYARPAAGPLADSTYVLPGSVLASAADLKAVVASIRPGMSVYFFR